MGKINKILDLIEEIRKENLDIMAEAPRKLWRAIMDLDECLDLVKYRAEALESKFVEVSMDD